MAEPLKELALSVLYNVMFSRRIAAAQMPRLHAALEARMLATTVRTAMFSMPGWVPRPFDRRGARADAWLDDHLARIVADRRAAPTETTDLLNVLLDARYDDGTPIEDAKVRTEMLFLVIGGHETTAAALLWTFAQLASHPEAAERVYREVDALGGRPVTPADMPQLEFVRACFDETQRLQGGLVFNPKRALVDDEIGGYRITAGATVVHSNLTLQRDPRFWGPDAEHFRPDRWLEGETPAAAFQNFGRGRRMCLGKRMAYIEAVLTVATAFRPIASACSGAPCSGPSTGCRWSSRAACPCSSTGDDPSRLTGRFPARARPSMRNSTRSARSGGSVEKCMRSGIDKCPWHGDRSWSRASPPPPRPAHLTEVGGRKPVSWRAMGRRSELPPEHLVAELVGLLDDVVEIDDSADLELLAGTLLVPISIPEVPDAARRVVIDSIEARADPIASGTLAALAVLAPSPLAAYAHEAASRLGDLGLTHPSAADVGTLAVDSVAVGVDDDAEIIVALLARPNSRARQALCARDRHGHRCPDRMHAHATPLAPRGRAAATRSDEGSERSVDDAVRDGASARACVRCRCSCP